MVEIRESHILISNFLAAAMDKPRVAQGGQRVAQGELRVALPLLVAQELRIAQPPMVAQPPRVAQPHYH